jgi:AraC-like DNA-binding protein
MTVNIQALVQDSSPLNADNSTMLNATIWAVLFVQYSVYLFQIVKITQRFKQLAEQELSNIELVDISWLNAFLYAFILVFTLLAILFAGAIHHFDTEWMNRLVSLSFSMAIFILGYKGLFQQSIFSNAEASVISTSITSEVVKPKVLDESLSVNLRKYMESFQPHRDSELTLTSLAKKVNLSRNQLSEVINSSLGCNFYDFVNKYRVEDVKQLMVNSRFKDYTLLAIAYEAGFPSKSTFNSIFKKFTGLTPSEYRNGLS